MQLSLEHQETMRNALKEYFPDHPQPEVEMFENDHSTEPVRFETLRSGITVPRSITASCSGAFRAVHHSGPRHANLITCEVIHCTQSDTAISAASWFTKQRSAGSAHRCIDNRICYRTLSDLLIPWAAPGLNLNGNHLEFAGRVEWSKAQWLERRTEIKRGAYKTAYDAKKYGFPITWLDENELRNGRRHGVTDHWTVSQAFHLSTHSDPRPNFPRELFMDLARSYRKQM